jgi:hypothetical protein
MDYAKYKNPYEYPKKPSKPVLPFGKAAESSDAYRRYAHDLDEYNKKLPAYNMFVEAYNKKDRELYEQFKKDAINEVGLEGHEAAERAFSYAWEEGHAHGYQEVMIHLERIAQVILGN